ncbi:hypothetical protein ACWGID_36795 [Kribbella sp. NPDC054772]
MGALLFLHGAGAGGGGGAARPPPPPHVASIGGIQNFASNIAGIISPYVFGLLLDRYHGSYVPSFAVAGAVAVVGALTYAFVVGKAEPLPVRDS